MIIHFAIVHLVNSGMSDICLEDKHPWFITRNFILNQETYVALTEEIFKENLPIRGLMLTIWVRKRVKQTFEINNGHLRKV